MASRRDTALYKADEVDARQLLLSIYALIHSNTLSLRSKVLLSPSL